MTKFDCSSMWQKALPGLNLAAGEDIEQAVLLNGWERSRRPFPDEQFPFPAAKRAVDKLKAEKSLISRICWDWPAIFMDNMTTVLHIRTIWEFMEDTLKLQ